ncbi:hypothetical protein MKX01_006741 [Papaver californicum]|nr:hypothetical protein MKX01_006741 [Papaver californicum]
MSSSFLFSIFFFTIIFCLSSFVAESTVPSSKTFKFINQGDFGDYVVEYDANYRALDFFIMRWVWDANCGNPVRENATLNLVLADADGRIAWQTGTANKGVVGLNLLSNGNIVLYDKSGQLIWQSFEHPGDTLLVGQGLRPNGPNRIISRSSDVDGSEGPYSFVLEKNRLNLYLKSKNIKKP